jgi:aminobenzoyl-glutamate utilization protein B
MTDHTLTTTRRIWAEHRDEIEALFAQMWAVPELSAMEFCSVDLLCTWLEKHGFAVQRGMEGVPTGFKATKGDGQGPLIGFLAEYDALPSLDNAAVPFRQGTGRKPGHGCGHNHIGPANTGAAIAAAAALEALNLPGTICVIGCPAEEILWGKLALLEAGAFDGLDAILTSHGDYQNGSLARPCHCTVSGEFRFFGRSAHSGTSTGQDALKSAEAGIAAVQAALT